MKKSLLFIACMLISLQMHAQWSTIQRENYHYESYGAVDLKGATFTILPADESISADNPKFMWFAQQTAPWVMLRGANYVTSVDEAELVLLLDYGVGETTPRTYNKPIWGRTGISSSSTTIRGNKINTTFTPSYGVVGYQQNTVNQYRKHIELYMYDANTSNGMNLLWQASIEMVGSSNNLQNVFPGMLYKFAINANICSEDNSSLNICDYDYNPTYNLFLGYSSRAVSEDYIPWRYLWRVKSDMTVKTYQKQNTKQCLIFPRAIVQLASRATVFFQVICVDPDWKISDLSNFYIEYNGQKYYAKSAHGLKNGKKLDEYKQRTFYVDFEPLPEEVQYGERYIAVKEEKKGKIIQGWDLCIEQ